ncbi:MAG: DUF971 domain-containing protein [Pseudomonadota bacterium]
MDGTEVPQSVVLDARGLRLRWADGETHLAATHLRARCQCAQCRQLRRQGKDIAVAPGIALDEALPVGAYGLQLRFSDGHDRGIYPWHMLRELAAAHDIAA